MATRSNLTFISPRATPAPPPMPPMRAGHPMLSAPAFPRIGAGEEDDGYEPLMLVVEEMARACDADGVLVSWHDGGNEPVLLFADDAWELHSSADPTLRHSAAAVPVSRDHAPHSAWSSLDDEGERLGGGLLTTSIPAGGGVVTVTTLFNRIGEGTRQRARDAAKRLMPLVQPFFRLWTARWRTLSRVRGLTAAVNKTGVGILLVNRYGQLLFANDTAEALLGENDGLRRTGATISSTRLADTLRLQTAIEHVIGDDTPGTAGAMTPVVALTRRKRRPLMAAVAASDTGSTRGEESAAIIYVFDPDQDLRPLIEPACKLYALSPVETRLTCLLADGVSLADAAEQMHVREQTARSYLKQIFLKTETNRQAELVWLMLKSSVRTAPGCRASFL